MRYKSDGIQKMRHITAIGEFSSAIQRGRSLAQPMLEVSLTYESTKVQQRIIAPLSFSEFYVNACLDYYRQPTGWGIEFVVRGYPGAQCASVVAIRTCVLRHRCFIGRCFPEYAAGSI